MPYDLGVSVTYRGQLASEDTTSLWPPPEDTRWVILGLVLAFCALIASNQLYWVISDFFNPEYYALRHLPFSK